MYMELQNLKAIDVLRAFALILVILFHSDWSVFKGGFVGVDIFFVISGFLITRIIVQEFENGVFSFTNFYKRRLRRLIPALYVVLISTFFSAIFLMTPDDFNYFSRSLATVSIFCSNVYFWRTTNYFESVTENNPLLHTWSLGIELQFYLVYPIILIFIVRKFRKYLLGIVLLLTCLSFAICLALSILKPVAAFYLLPSRFWQFLLGSVAYLLAIKRANLQNMRILKPIVSIATLTLLTILFTFDGTNYPGWKALLPSLCCFTLLLYLSNRDIPYLTNNAVIMKIGLMSYSLYLWHYPVFLFIRNEFGNLTFITFALAIFLVYLLSLFTYNAIELPFRGIKPRKIIQSRHYIATTLVLLGLSFAGNAMRPYQESVFLSRFPAEQRQYYKALFSKSLPDANYSASETGLQDLTDCRFNTSQIDEVVRQRIQSCFIKFGGGTIIIGDSHAIDLFGTFASRYRMPFLVGITSGGCELFSNGKHCRMYQDIRNFLVENPGRFVYLFYEVAGHLLMKDKSGSYLTDNQLNKMKVDEKMETQVDFLRIKEIRSYLASLSEDLVVTWFLPRIEPRFSKFYMRQQGCKFRYSLRPGQRYAFYTLEKEIINQVESAIKPRINFVSSNKLFDFQFPRDLASCKEVYWNDGNHFSTNGEIHFGLRLPKDFTKLVAHPKQ